MDASLIAGTLTKASAPESIASWWHVSQHKGSNPGGVYEDESGQQWYVKFPQLDPEQSRAELLATLVYRTVGLPVPEKQLVSGHAGWGEASGLGIAGKMVEGEQLDSDELAESPDVRDGFLTDCLLANHDVIGSSGRNILRVDGRDLRIDNGSTFAFRAQGQDKDVSAIIVPEIDSMRDRETAPDAAPIFAGFTDDELQAQAQHLVATLDDDTIRELVNEAGLSGKYANALIGRRDAIGARFGVNKALTAWESLSKYSPDQPRDEHGRWTEGAAPQPVSKGWVTIRGAHVFIDEAGRITHGPHSMVGHQLKPDGSLVADKCTAALKNFKPALKAHQRKADANEQRVAEAVGGERTPDNSPLDIYVRAGGGKVGLEVKTLLGKKLTNVRINMRPECRERKLEDLTQNRAKGYCVLIDNRGGGEKIFVHEGMGAFRIGQMTPLKNLKQLRAFISKITSPFALHKLDDGSFLENPDAK